MFFSVILILFDNFGFLKLPKTGLQYLTIPVQYGLYKSGTNLGKQFEFIVLARRAAQENKALRAQLGETLTKMTDLDRELRETKILIDQYNKLSPKTFDLIPARIIGTGRYTTLDKGSNDGVAVGEVVVFQEHYLGQIIGVTPKISEMRLLTDPDSKISVFSQGSGHARGILLGQFGSETLMDKILHQEQIAEGDLIYSEGLEGNLPKGLIMGKVTKVLDRQNEIFKQAKVEPIFNISDLEVVFVIKNS